MKWRIIIPVALAVGCVAVLNIFGIAKPPTLPEPAPKTIDVVEVSETIQVKAITPTPKAIEVEKRPIATVFPTPEPILTATLTPEPIEEVELAEEEEQTPEPTVEPQEEPVEDSEPIEEEPQPAEPEPTTEPTDASGMEYCGTWTISFYCPCYECCGEWSGGATASGVYPTAWHTVACGSLPFGTEIYIDGLGYFVVEDRGVYGEWVDVFVDDHDLCNELGLQYLDVYIVG